MEEGGCQVQGAADGFSLRAPPRNGPIEAEGEEDWAWGSPCCTSLSLWIFVVQIPLVTISAQAQRNSSDFLKKTGPVDRVEGVLQVHGQEAPVFLSLFVFPEPTSWTMASRPLLVPNPSCAGRRYRVMSADTAASIAFAVRRRRVSPTTTGQWLPSFSASEAQAIQWCQGRCLLPRFGPARPARRCNLGGGPPVMCCERRPDGPAVESGAKDRSASWTNVSEGLWTGRPEQSGEISSWPRPPRKVRGDGLASP